MLRAGGRRELRGAAVSGAAQVGRRARPGHLPIPGGGRGKGGRRPGSGRRGRRRGAGPAHKDPLCRAGRPRRAEGRWPFSAAPPPRGAGPGNAALCAAEGSWSGPAPRPFVRGRSASLGSFGFFGFILSFFLSCRRQRRIPAWEPLSFGYSM